MITQNQYETLRLPVGQVLSLTVNGTGSLVRLTVPASNEPYSPVPLTADVSFGPYAEERSYRLECVTGSISYAFSAADPALLATVASVANAVAVAGMIYYDAGAPVDYTDGTPPATGEGTAVKGALYIDTINGFVYRNSGTQAHPAWTKLADAA